MRTPTIAIAVLATLTPFRILADDKTQVGRFQLVPAVVFLSSGAETRNLFKIDTVTGETWQYHLYKEKDGTTSWGWDAATDVDARVKEILHGH